MNINPNDEMYFNRILGPELPQKVLSEYMKVKHAADIAGHTGPLGPVYCAVIVRMGGIDPPPRKRQNPQIDWNLVDPGTMVVCTVDDRRILGIFQHVIEMGILAVNLKSSSKDKTSQIMAKHVVIHNPADMEGVVVEPDDDEVIDDNEGQSGPQLGNAYPGDPPRWGDLEPGIKVLVSSTEGDLEGVYQDWSGEMVMVKINGVGEGQIPQTHVKLAEPVTA